MKKIKYFTLGILLVGAVSMMSCEKKATQDELTNQKPESTVFNLKFSPSVSSNSFSGIKGYMKGDVILVYGWTKRDGKEAWVALPGTVYHTDSQTGLVSRSFVFEEQTGKLHINTFNADGTSGSPWTKDMNFQYKAVVVKSSAIQENPDVDLKNYKEVKKRFNLED